MKSLFSLMLVMLMFAGCVSSTMETRTVNPDGTYTVESETTTAPSGGAVVGEPWVGVGTPWVYYNDAWYYNGIQYGFYGNIGWWPYGYYGNNLIVRNNVWYNNNWYGFYRNNPIYYNNFRNKYHGGQRWHGNKTNFRGHRPAGPTHRGNVHRPVGPTHRGNVHRPAGPTHRGNVNRPANQSKPIRSTPTRRK